ncbi:endocuticle structural glycoprotein SgAbd-2-like [Pieris brassicae]|nr:endocuticle structural glycoprotein SgAbd-2-like [Pieris brassicae]
MLGLAVCVGLSLQVVLCDPAPATTAAVQAAPTVPTSSAFVNPNFAGNPAFSGYNGYRSCYNTASPNVPIISYSSNRGPDGSYSYSYATGDGKQAQESGFLKDAYIDNTGSPQGTQVVEGSYAYTSPEGTPIQVSYVADENGFRTAGVHIPADGKGVAPALLGNGVAPGLLGNGYNHIYDPRQNRFNYDPRYNSFNNYQSPHNFNQYNPARPFAARYNLYNPYRNVKDIKKTV